MSTACIRGSPCTTFFPILVATRRRCRGVALPSTGICTAGTWDTTPSRRCLVAFSILTPRSVTCTDTLDPLHEPWPPTYVCARIGRPLPSATALPFPPACSDRLLIVSTLCRDVNRMPPLTPCARLTCPLLVATRRRRRGVALPPAGVCTAGTWNTTPSRRYLLAFSILPPRSYCCTDTIDPP